jgi:hypothetical protein
MLRWLTDIYEIEDSGGYRAIPEIYLPGEPGNEP